MAQHYGASYGVDGEPRDEAGASEETSLLGSESVGKIVKADGHATLASGVGNLANTIVGSGAFFVTFIMSSRYANIRSGMLTFPLVCCLLSRV